MQSDRSPSPQWSLARERLFAVLLPALVMVGLNCFKPAHIDDTLFLSFARQILHHPLDPYGFEMFWFQRPEPANWVLCPLGVPYWLAPGMAIFGENIVLLKIWMLPFAVLLLASVRGIMIELAADGRDQPHDRPAWLWMTALSPAVLPGFNLMLDVPVLALMLAATRVMLNSKSAGGSMLAGGIAAVAIFVKWTAFLSPPLLLAIALIQRRWRHGLLAGAVTALLVIAWESWVASRYGQSHLLFYALVGGSEDPGPRMLALRGLPVFLGAGAGILLPLLASRDRTLSWALLPVPLIAWALSPFALTGEIALGVVGGAVLARAAWESLWQARSSPRGRASVLLLTWLLVELLGYFVITPFPAMRRVMGLSIVCTLIAWNTWQTRGRRTTQALVWTAAIAWAAVGIVVQIVDSLDARALRNAVAVAEQIRHSHPDANIYYNGHWGFQYYAERAGLKPLVPDETLLRAGDWLIMNDVSVAAGLINPGSPVRETVYRDAVPLSGVQYYAGERPLILRSPRLRVGLFQFEEMTRLYGLEHPQAIVDRLERRFPHLSSRDVYPLITAMRFGDRATSARASNLLLNLGSDAIDRALAYEDDPRVQQWGRRAKERGR